MQRPSLIRRHAHVFLGLGLFLGVGVSVMAHGGGSESSSGRGRRRSAVARLDGILGDWLQEKTRVGARVYPRRYLEIVVPEPKNDGPLKPGLLLVTDEGAKFSCSGSRPLRCRGTGKLKDGTENRGAMNLDFGSLRGPVAKGNIRWLRMPDGTQPLDEELAWIPIVSVPHDEVPGHGPEGADDRDGERLSGEQD